MKAKKLPSGSWRCRAYWYTDEAGKAHYKSFTCTDPSPQGKRICEAEATAWAIEKKETGHKLKTELTFAAALEEYINERAKILSPSSVRKYRGLQRNHFDEINGSLLVAISQDDVQRMINRMVGQGYSPKTITEVSTMVSTVLKRHNISPIVNTVKPKKRKKETYVPTTEDIQKILNEARGTCMELPVMLGAFCGMRRGEISALQASDRNGRVLHIHRNMVDTPEHDWITKDPKTEAGDRFVVLPESVAELFPDSGKVTKLRPNMITSRFYHLLERAGVPHFRFHDLRHWNTSIKHDLGVPDAVILQENGWSRGDDKIMKEVYRHTLAGREFSTVAVEFFDGMTRNMTRNEKKP